MNEGLSERDRRVLSQQQAAVVKLIGDLAARQEDMTGAVIPVALLGCVRVFLKM